MACYKLGCFQIWFGLFLIFVCGIVTYEWLFVRYILETGNIEYNYDYNTTNMINDSVVPFYCNPHYIIIADSSYQDLDSLGYHLINNGDNIEYKSSSDLLQIEGIYIDRKQYLSSSQISNFNIFFYLSFIGLILFGIILFIRSLPLLKKDEYLRRYLIELLIVDIISIILLSISISIISRNDYSCVDTLNNILIDLLLNTIIIYTNITESNGETLLILYAVIVIHIIFIIAIIILIFKMKSKKQDFDNDDNDDNNVDDDGTTNISKKNTYSEVEGDNQKNVKYGFDTTTDI